MRSCLFVLAVLVCTFGFATVASAQSTFVYTADTLGSSISIYKMNTTTGALTASGGSPFQNDQPDYLASTAGGKFLVVSGGQCPGCGLQTFAINPTTGALTLSHAYEQIGAVSFQATQIVSDATGNTIYAQGPIQNGTFTTALDALQVNADGSLTQVGTPFLLPRDSTPAARRRLLSIQKGAGSLHWWLTATINSSLFPLRAMLMDRWATWATQPAFSIRSATAIRCCRTLPLIRKAKTFSFHAIRWEPRLLKEFRCMESTRQPAYPSG